LATLGSSLLLEKNISSIWGK